MALQEKDIAAGMVVNFRHPEDTRIDVHYDRYTLFDTEWRKGYQSRTFSITINDQCEFVPAIMDVKKAADALGIDFGDSPTITVEIPRDSPLVNGYYLCKKAAEKLGWTITCPDWFIPRPASFEFEPD